MADERCGVCGEPVVARARFCHGCGAALDVPVIDVFEVSGRALESYDSTVTEPVSLVRRIGVPAAILAAMAMLGVVLLSGNDPSPEDADAPTPGQESTTSATSGPEPTAVDDSSLVALGARLDLRSRAEIVQTVPVALVEHAGAFYLFGQTVDGPYRFFVGPEGRTGGLETWRSGDGTEWERIDAAFDPTVQVLAAASTPWGLAVAGVRSDGTMALWLSADAADWTPIEVPIEVAPSEVVDVVLLAGDQDALWVIAHTGGRSGMEWTARLPPPWPDVFARHWPRGYESDDVEIRFLGPFGLRLGSVRFDEVDDPAALRAVMNGQAAQGRVVALRLGVGGNWTEVSLPGAGHGELVFVDGSVVLTGSSDSYEPVTWISDDNGVTWRDQLPGVSGIAAYAGEIVAIDGDGARTPLLTATPDDTAWSRLSLADVAGLDGNASPQDVAVSEAGTAVVAVRWTEDSVPPEPEPLMLVVDDSFLIIDQSPQPTFRVDGPDGYYEIPTSSETPDGVTVDLVRATVVFSDPNGTARAVSVPLEALWRLEERSWYEPGGTRSQSAVLFSPDRATWRRALLGEVQGFGYTTVALGADTLVAAQVSFGDGYSTAPRVTLWSASTRG